MQPANKRLVTEAAVPAHIENEVTTPGTPTATALSATYVPKWKANTAYLAGDAVLSPSGDKVTAKADFTSGATYSAANWNVTPSDAMNAAVLSRSRKGDPAKVRFARPRAKFLTNFPAGHTWYVGGTYGSANANYAGGNIFGDQSVHFVTSGATASSCYVSSPTPGGLPAFVPQDHHVRVWVKYDGPDKLHRIRLFLSDTNTFTNYYSIDYSVSSSIATVDSFPWKYGEWTPVTFNMADATVVGTAPDKSLLKHMRVLFNDRNTPATIDVGKIEYVPKGTKNPTCVISLTYDDSHAGQYTYARKHLAAYGFRGELFPIVDWIDSGADYMTSAQVRELHDLHGWDVSPHASSYAAHSQKLTGMTDAQVDAEMNAVLDWHEANGYETLVYAYPSGVFTSANVTIVRKYFPAARMAAKYQTETQPPYLPHRIQVRNGASTSVATIKAEIDKAVAEGTAYHLMFHDVIAGATTGNHINEADHKSLIDYIAASGATVRTLTDLVKDYAG